MPTAVRSPPPGEPQRDDATLGAPHRLSRRAVRPGRLVAQAGHILGSVAAHPFRHGGAGDLQPFGHAGLHPTVLNDQPDEFAAPFQGQWRIGVANVRDEGLRYIE